MKNKKILCLSSIDWDFLWQRHQAIMTEFSRRGWHVYFLNNTGFRNPRMRDLSRIIGKLNVANPRNKKNLVVPSNITIINPLLLPPNGFIFRILNKYFLIPLLLRKLRMKGLDQPELLYCFLPSYTTLNILRSYKRSKKVFDYVSHFSAHPYKPWDYEAQEQNIFKEIDLVLTDSDFLFGKLVDKNIQAIRFHHGVEIEKFSNELSSEWNPKISYKSVCFFGAIDDRMDWNALIALRDSGARVVLLGEIKTDVKIPEGIEYRGKFEHSDLPRELAKYDAFIIPYKVLDFSNGIIPAKIFECFATGKPCLVSPLPSFQKFNDILYICNEPSDYVKAFGLLAKTENYAVHNQRKDVAAAHSSEVVFEQLLEILKENDVIS